MRLGEFDNPLLVCDLFKTMNERRISIIMNTSGLTQASAAALAPSFQPCPSCSIARLPNADVINRYKLHRHTHRTKRTSIQLSRVPVDVCHHGETDIRICTGRSLWRGGHRCFHCKKMQSIGNREGRTEYEKYKRRTNASNKYTASKGDDLHRQKRSINIRAATNRVFCYAITWRPVTFTWRDGSLTKYNTNRGKEEFSTNYHNNSDVLNLWRLPMILYPPKELGHISTNWSQALRRSERAAIMPCQICIA